MPRGGDPPFILMTTTSSDHPDLCPQPYYSTRVNAGDIGSRVKQLDETTQKQLEGESEKSKAGFWEEFDVRLYLTSYCAV